MSSSHKLNLDLLTPDSPQERQNLDETVTAIATTLANSWKTLRKVPEGPLEQTTINLPIVLGPYGELLKAVIKFFTHKLADGRTVKTTSQATPKKAKRNKGN